MDPARAVVIALIVLIFIFAVIEFLR